MCENKNKKLDFFSTSGIETGRVKNKSEPFKRQFHKKVKHIQTIRRQFADELFEWVWQFCGTGA